MLRKIEMRTNSKNFENSQMYMVSWTSTIKHSLTQVFSLIGDTRGAYKFVDIGCGKGKVALMARNLGIVGANPNSYIGIDFETTLVEIAKTNSTKMFGDKGTFILSDVLNIDFSEFRSSLVVFLYNPFDEKIMRVFLKKISAFKPILVYVNPAHRNVILNHGFKSIKKNVGWHANLCFEIFELSD